MLNKTFGRKIEFIHSIADEVLQFPHFKNKYHLKKKPGRIIFVCKGNICRSAFAEAVLKYHSDIDTESCGIDAPRGDVANKRVVDFSKSIDVDMESHRSKNISDVNFCETDLVVFMEFHHLKWFKANNPNINCVMLGLFDSFPFSRIPDPYGLSDEYVKECLLRIKRATINLSKAIENV